jgi:simple sugar transport system ATP-binding protein
MDQMGHLIEAKGISKVFGYVEVLKDVDIEIGHNEIVGLVGDNGAGKSTLIKILTGVHKQDNGELSWKGERLTNHSVPKARDLGIVTVFQDKAIVEQHTIWRNIFLGREITNALGFLDVRKQMEETDVAISRALYFDADLIILDEPTTGLSLSETRKVLSFVKTIRSTGKACIFITHNLFHVYAVADRIVALDRGRVVGNFLMGEITLEKLEEKMLEIAGTGNVEDFGVLSTGKSKERSDE